MVRGVNAGHQERQAVPAPTFRSWVRGVNAGPQEWEAVPAPTLGSGVRVP